MKQKLIDETDESFHKPTDEEISETTEATRLALEKITTAKVHNRVKMEFFFFFQFSDCRGIARPTCQENGASPIHSLHSQSAVGNGCRRGPATHHPPGGGAKGPDGTAPIPVLYLKNNKIEKP